MRRLLLLLLIGFLPFQTWAGVLLSSGQLGGSTITSDLVVAGLPCHAAADQADGQATAQAHLPDQVGICFHGPACQDAQACDLCHLSLSLPGRLAIVDSVRPHPLPSAYALWRPGRHWPPPLEPPRL